MSPRGLPLLLALALLAACRPAAAVITSNVCYQRWTLDWRVATIGPIFMCGGDGSNSTVTFKWNANEDHGVFQIPTDACPSTFTGFATERYRELAAAGRVGEFTWQLPTQPGDYWVTSQANSDCTNGMKALIRVTPADYTQKESAIPGPPPANGSSGLGASWQTRVLAAALALLAAALAGL